MSRLLLIACAFCLLIAERSLLAKQNVPDVKPDKPWLAIVIAVVLMLFAAAASVITPKRTHQD